MLLLSLTSVVSAPLFYFGVENGLIVSVFLLFVFGLGWGVYKASDKWIAALLTCILAVVLQAAFWTGWLWYLLSKE
jgi:hypothetical protein